MQYDPLIEILNVAENSVEHAGKAAAISFSASSVPIPRAINLV
jgi:hypothetical protein